MQPQLASIAARFDRVQERWHALAARVPEERWARRADPARWSVAECVAHLNLTAEAYLPLVRRAIDEARGSGRPAPRRYRRDPMGMLVGIAAGPPLFGARPLFRVRTPVSFVPTGEGGRTALLAEFDRLQEAQRGLLRASDGLPIDAVKIASPFGPMRYSAYSALALLPGHQERHLLQAAAVWPA